MFQDLIGHAAAFPDTEKIQRQEGRHTPPLFFQKSHGGRGVFPCFRYDILKGAAENRLNGNGIRFVHMDQFRDDTVNAVIAAFGFPFQYGADAGIKPLPFQRQLFQHFQPCFAAVQPHFQIHQRFPLSVGLTAQSGGFFFGAAGVVAQLIFFGKEVVDPILNFRHTAVKNFIFLIVMSVFFLNGGETLLHRRLLMLGGNALVLLLAAFPRLFKSFGAERFHFRLGLQKVFGLAFAAVFHRRQFAAQGVQTLFQNAVFPTRRFGADGGGPFFFFLLADPSAEKFLFIVITGNNGVQRFQFPFRLLDLQFHGVVLLLLLMEGVVLQRQRRFLFRGFGLFGHEQSRKLFVLRLGAGGFFFGAMKPFCRILQRLSEHTDGEMVFFFGKFQIFFGVAGVFFQRPQTVFDLRHDIGEPRQILIGVVHFAQRFFFPFAVFHDPRRFLHDGTAFFGTGIEDLRDTSLTDDGIAVTADAAVGKETVNIF